MTPEAERLEAERHLERLAAILASSDIEVEFYFVRGAVIFQAFAARPETAHVDAMFRPAESIRAAARQVAESENLPERWLHRSVGAALSDGADPSRYVELPRVRAFVAPPEYVLAIKTAAMRLGEAFRETEDVRFLARAMNLTSAAEARSIVARYFTDRQLPADTHARLQTLIDGAQPAAEPGST